MPVVAARITFSRRGFCAEVEDPASDKVAENGDVGYNDGDVVFNVVDAVVDRIRPVGLEERVQTVTVRKIDLSSADGSDAGERVSFVSVLCRHYLRKTARKDCQHDETGAQAGTHHPSNDNEGNRQDQNVGEQVGASDPDQHLAHPVATHAVQTPKRPRLPSVAS